MENQVTIGEVKIRQVAQEYLKIQENTQYLTHLIRYSSKKKKIIFQGNCIADFKCLATLSVQLSYLLFTCQVKQVDLLINKNFYLLNPNKKEQVVEIFCEYMLAKDFQLLKEQEQKWVQQNFMRYQFSNQGKKYGQYVLHFLNILISIVKKQFDKARTQYDQRICKNFQNLNEIINTFIAPQIQKIQHPRVFILALQQSQIFRQFSVLVKVMNNSIFSTIRNNKMKQELFKQICYYQQSLKSIKQKEKSLNSGILYQQNQKILQEFIKNMLKKHIITVQQSINDQKGDKTKPQTMMSGRPPIPMNKGMPQPFKQSGMTSIVGKSSMPPPSMNPQNNMRLKQQSQMNQQNAQSVSSTNIILGEIEGTSIKDRRYTSRIQVSQKKFRPFSKKIWEQVLTQAQSNYKGMTEQQNSDELGDVRSNQIKNEFLIEYIPSKQILSVRYITSIDLNVDNTDLVMFQCNNIAYHWSNVSMELIQKSPNKANNKRKDRYLAIKTLTHLNITDRPLFKILLMIDLVMMAAKIADPELRKASIRAEDFNRIQDISLKVEHMIKLFIRKIEKYYKIIAQKYMN